MEALGHLPPTHPNYRKAFVDTVTIQDIRAAFPNLGLFHLERGHLYSIMPAGERSDNAVPLAKVYGR